MKSVVVEASTVAKAIETAWLKAEKPEEFFIRILQEHITGFLGFGSQKAKIVLFFKNSNKSDALVPVVLKQKEYISFFGNKNLKNPTELNKVDADLNKNINLGQQKPKHHNNNQQSQPQTTQQGQQQKAQHKNQATQQQQQQKNQQLAAKPQHKTVPSHQSAQQNGKPVHTQKPVHQHEQKPVHTKNNGVEQHKKPMHHAANEKPVIKAAKEEFKKDVVMNAAPQPKPQQPKVVMPVEKIEHKEDIVKSIASVLKKVQTQKIVANVSKSVAQQNQQVKVTSEPVVVREEKSVMTAAPTAPRVPIKMKRRPLNTDNSGVSGITKSTDSDDTNFNV